MKKSWNIFSRDGRNLFTNYVALIVIGGLMILPSLYAWFNIEASWDPYGKTDQLPVAVVNEDEGATIRDESIDVGGDLVKELKKNDDMDWHFVNREKAMDKVEYGDYFAVIVIPKDFSQKLSTVIEDKPEKAKLEYYVNEKINAIAPKITEKGAGAIVDKITSSFISTVNETIFDMFNELGLEIEGDLPDIKNFENYVFEAEERLPDIGKTLNDSLSDAEKAQGMIDDAQSMIPEASRVTNEGLETIDNTTAFLDKAEKRLDEIAPQVQKDLEQAQSTSKKINDFLQSVQTSDIDLSQGDTISNDVQKQVDSTIQNIESIESSLQQVKEQNPPPQEGEENQNEESQQNQEQIDQALEQLGQVKKQLQQVQSDGEKINEFLSGKQQEVDDVINGIQERSAETSANIDAFVKEYNNNIEPTVRSEVASAKKTLSDARSILVDIQSTIPEVEKILSSTEGNLSDGEKTLKDVLGEYPYVNTKVNELADRIREIQGETDINEIIKLLKNDPKLEKSFFEEPVKMNKNSLYPIQNYGTAMTPFYTVLAIWVGGLLLISLLATDVMEGIPDLKERHIYFGKLMTFLSIGFIQTIIVTLGDIFLLGVDISSPGWFVLFGLLISAVFITIVYTFVSVFGNVGKALAIVLLVLQIAGSGGTYPTALLPEFFQIIHPFLPFSYAIDLMREAVGGIVWERVTKDIMFLVLFWAIAIFLGTFLKQPLSKRTKAFMKKSKESGLFH